MTRLAIISDIHANIHALHAVWKDIQTQRISGLYCLGDLVGYGAYPNEVVEFIQARNIPVIMGNYDQAVGFDLDDCGCTYEDSADEERSKASLMWTREHVTDSNKAWLRTLPEQRRPVELPARLLLVHGSPHKINEYLYEDRPTEMFERLAEQAKCDVMCFGHTHMVYQKQVNDTLFVNAGSVGKPKDGDSRAGYVILDLSDEDTPKAEVHRVTYDVVAAAGAIRTSGLPSHFADQLITGGRALGKVK